MSAEENKALVRRIFEEIFDGGNLELTDELIVPDYVLHDPASPGEVRGPDGYKQFAGVFRTAFPDIRHTIEDQVAEGDKVATRLTARGTHQGDLMGIPPTGKEVTIRGITIFAIAGGKVVEQWLNYDAMGLMQQLGDGS